jgi:hypothetical protein
MAILEIAKIQVRRGEENVTGIPQLDPGEFGWAQDTEKLYIGKRISEGATSDDNTRILTENDKFSIVDELGGVLRSLLGPRDAGASTATYRYRALDPHINSTITTIAIKLDNTVSLTDYDVTASYFPVDITDKLRNAVNDLFRNSDYNDWQRTDARRKLVIPAGNYLLSSTVELPPYTYLVGEGQEITILSSTDPTTAMFKTVDAMGNFFETENMLDGPKRAREVTLESMTLQYRDAPPDSSTPSLVYLDNVLNARVEDVTFRTALVSTETTTYGLVNGGGGITIRGTGGGFESGDANLCENININRCRFDSLYTAIDVSGSVVRTVVTNSILNNLDRGVKLYELDQQIAPSNGIISNNRFSNIVKEAIWVNTSSNRTMHISENNFFIQVGNGTDLDDNIITSTNTTPVITFNSEGNKTVNDYFHRRLIADASDPSSNFYYAPLIDGITIIDDSAIFLREINTTTNSNSGLTSIAKIPLSGRDQMATVRYQLYNTYISRKGNIIINIASDGFASLTDIYNFSSTNTVEDDAVTTATGVFSFSPSNTQFVVDLNANPRFRDVIGVSPYPGNPTSTDQTWYIVDPTADNNAALITSFTTASGEIAVFDTQSSPVMTFNTNTSFILSRSIATPIVIDTETNLDRNYVLVTAKNLSTSTATISTFEYNINILQ